ncbi:MAG: hypothetical protein IT284_01400 [Bacteroidetes bacterium]|nr:hypothetical protein [Bacteroidota bacterium]
MKEDMEVVSKPKIRRKKTEKISLSAILLGIIILGGTFYFYDKHNEEKSTVKAGDVAKMISIALGVEESPKIMAVTDVKKLGDEEFFSGAKNGDIILIYENLKKVVLYDPISGEIIKISNIN